MLSKPDNLQQHFLIVSLSIQGQLIPIRRLALKLVRLSGARITIAHPLSSHRLLFPNSTVSAGELDDSTEEQPINPDGSGIISYAPFSDGYDDGFDPFVDSFDTYTSGLKSIGFRTLSSLVRSLVERGRPISCMIYSLLSGWAADLAQQLGVPSALLWIQNASLFSTYHRFFCGLPDYFSSPLADLGAADLPPLLKAPNPFRDALEEIFTEIAMPERKAMVLVNTFEELEGVVMKGLSGMEIFLIGPVGEVDLEKGYGGEDACMDWLESQESGSVVYVAFGSITKTTMRQKEELARGLKESGRPYLWVQRKDGGEGSTAERENDKGLVVPWCSQNRVLAHRAIGCFITHGGWNSMTEAMMSGIPMVVMADWMDQPTNAALAEKAWGIGVRPARAEDGVVEAAEMRRCIGIAMGEDDTGKEMRRRAEEWKKKAAEAVGNDGSSTGNLRIFLKRYSESEFL